MPSRVFDLLTTRAAIWLVGFAVGVTILVSVTLVGIVLGVALAIPLVIVAAAFIVLKDRVLILRRRILVTRQRTSRRQFLATTLSISIAAALTAVCGWLLGSFILGSYEDQVRRHTTRKPKPPPK